MQGKALCIINTLCKGKKEPCIIGGESRGIRISSRNNGRFNRHLRIGSVLNLILLTRENYYKFRLQYKNSKSKMLSLMCLEMLLSKHNT